MSGKLKKIDSALREPPTLLGLQDISKDIVDQFDILRLEQLHLRFTNGVERRFHRIKQGRGAVMMVPLLDANTVLLIREYAAGTERYELCLPKGRLEPNENILEAANRELMEEIGYGAKHLQELNQFTLAPTFMGHKTHVILARDLYEKRLPGDEPEELEVIPWCLSNLHELVARPDCSEGRSIAALYWVKDLLEQGMMDAK